jgi:DNA mismatch endonuclease (patch repair protein)
MDKLTPSRRSWNMSRIGSRNTRPERFVRSMLHSLGLRFRLNVTHLPGSPDIVLAKWRTAIFVHGCFWHRHPNCKFAYEPKSRLTFWDKKFQQNVVRDAANYQELQELGWRVIVVWECETREPSRLRSRLRRLFPGSKVRINRQITYVPR